MFKKINEKCILAYLKAKQFLTSTEGASEFNDGGSSNWAMNTVIGLGIIAVFYTAMKIFVPNIIGQVETKIINWLSSIV